LDTRKRLKQQATMDDWLIRHQMVPDQLDEVVEIIRNTFIGVRRAITPGYRMSAGTRRMSWREVAMMVIENDIDPEMFVLAVAEEYGAHVRWNCLVGQSALSIYHRRVNNPKQKDEIEGDIQRSLRRIHDELALDIPLSKILLDPKAGFSSLFIWCTAKKAGLQEIVDRFEKPAMELYKRPMHRQVYTSAYPEVFSRGDS